MEEAAAIPEEAAVVEEEVAVVVVGSEAEITLPSDEVAFEMPEKFAGKSAEDIAKSYMELEAHRQKKEEEGKPDDKIIEGNAEADTERLITEYAERGEELSEEDYQVLKEKGYSRQRVDIYKAGVQAQKQAAAAATLEKAGTNSAEANEALAWARENWSEERITQFNKTIDSVDQEVQIQMIQMLTDGYRGTISTTEQAEGPIHGQHPPQATNRGYANMNQMIADMSDPRYDMRTFQYDQEYYNAVRAKAAISDF